MRKIFLFLTASLFVFMVSCGGNSNKNTEKESNDVENVNKSDEETSVKGFKALADVQDFLIYVVDGQGMPNTFESEMQDYLFFRADGSMAGGGPEGESSMWEATWRFEGQSLIIDITMKGDIEPPVSGKVDFKVNSENGGIMLNGTEYYISAY